MVNVIIIATAVLLFGYLGFSKNLSGSSSWRATVTPLASIMGSGFLVSAPLLAGIVGNFAVFCMMILLILAYAVGSVIRFNIHYYEPIDTRHGRVQEIAFLSRLILAGAYFISVTYYLQLLAAFLLNALNYQDQFVADCITSTLLLFISGIGIWKGLDMLEGLEKYAVSLNLSMIGALLVGLLVYNVQFLLNGSWVLPDISSEIDTHDVRVLLGLLIVVQGFETSRYIGEVHPAAERITTMRRAQLISSAIYIVFIALTTVLFQNDMGADVTAIIYMTAPVAAVLPFLLSIAAIGSQFSAAVADNEGAGGLLESITNKKLSIRYAYLLILFVTLALTWETNVNAIIAYASRAFALYYTFQCVIACMVAVQLQEVPNRNRKLIMFGVTGVCCLLVFVLGLPSE